MQDVQTSQASRPQFKLERLQDRLLLSAVLEDGSEVIDEVFTEETPVEEYVEIGEPIDVAGEVPFEDLMFYTMVVDMEVGTDSELIDPMPVDTGEEVYFGEGTGEEVIICTFGELNEEGEILGDPGESVPDEVLMYSTGGPVADTEVQSVAEVGQEAPRASIAAVDGISGDVLGSSDDLLGGSDSLL